MERIVLEVDGRIAKAWRQTTSQLREQIEKDFEIRAAEIIRKANEKKFEQSLGRLRNTAAANGLTPEILEALLNEEN